MSVSNSNADEMSNSSIKYYDESTVQEASQFMAKILRHGVDNVDALVNSRGWMSGKTLRLVLQENFPEVVNTKDLLADVLRYDDDERFQYIEDDPMYIMVRARYGHTLDHIELYDVEVDESDMQTYIVSATESGKRSVVEAYVSAVDKDTAKQIFVEREMNNMSLGDRTVDCDKVSVSVDTDMLKRSDTPFSHYTQDASYDNQVRSNMMGHMSEYYLTDKRSTDRIPETN